MKKKLGAVALLAAVFLGAGAAAPASAATLSAAHGSSNVQLMGNWPDIN